MFVPSGAPESFQLDSSDESNGAYTPGIVDAGTHILDELVRESALRIETGLSNAEWCEALAAEVALDDFCVSELV
eukprot:4207884-Pyramimonas_sp.AAC.1